MTFRNTNRQTAIPYLLPVRCVLFLLSFVVLSHFTKLPYFALGKWWTAVAIVCNFITIAILYATLRIKKITVGRLLGYEKGKTKIKSAIFIVTVMLLVGMGGLYLAGLICYAEFPHLDKTMVQPVPLWLAVIVLLLLPISTFIAEDGLYLGYAINLSSLHKWVNVSFAAFFYALQHSFIPFMPDGTFLLYRFLSFLPLTVQRKSICVFGIIYVTSYGIGYGITHRCKVRYGRFCRFYRFYFIFDDCRFAWG